jgi:hypothetical protein
MMLGNTTRLRWTKQRNKTKKNEKAKTENMVSSINGS